MVSVYVCVSVCVCVCFCLCVLMRMFAPLDGTPYGRLWEGTTPVPPTRLTHLTHINVDNFILHKVLGKGSFGKVGIAMVTYICFVASVRGQDY